MRDSGWSGTARIVSLAAAGALAGCVAQIREQREVGPSQAEPRTSSWVIVERRAPRDAGSEGETEPQCRSVVVTGPLVRQVDIRRSYVDPADQERNAVLLVLAATAAGAIAYGADQSGCAKPSTCDELTTAEWALAGLAAIPLGFFGYNALRARDDWSLEATEPARAPGPWRPCSDSSGPKASPAPGIP